MVLRQLAKVVPDIEERVDLSVLRVAPGMNTTTQLDSRLWDMHFPAGARRRVFLWPDSVNPDDPGGLLPLWYILMENLALNFELVMPPAESDCTYWCDFVLLQLEQVDAVVVTPTPTLCEQIKDALDGSPPIGQTQSCHFLAEFLCPQLCCKADPFQCVRRTLPPTVVGLAGLGLDDAYYLSGFVFSLNSDIPLLMATLAELILMKK